MKLKNVVIVLGILGILLLLNGIDAISNQDVEKNLITEEDRRAAHTPDKNDQKRADTHKRGLYLGQSGYGGKTHFTPSGYSGSSYSGPGYSYGPPGYQQSGSGYSSSSGSDATGYGGGYGGGYGSSHGYGHSAPGGYGHGGHGHSALALKGLLIPLAGIALLGAAAALSTNPVLLQLGVVNGRRKRDVGQDLKKIYPWNPYIRPKRI